MGIKTNKELQRIFKIDEKQIDALLKRNQIISELSFPKRYNDKTILKKKLNKVWFMFQEKGFGQKKQINIILDLFDKAKFSDINSMTKGAFNKIRVTYQEPAIKEYRIKRKIRLLIQGLPLRFLFHIYSQSSRQE
jgi:hypothetical protein